MARTAAGSVSSFAISSGFGEVNGWCIAWYLSVSSSHSNNGKSNTHKGANTSGFLSPNSSAKCNLNVPNAFLVLSNPPDIISNKSPSSQPAFAAHAFLASSSKNLSTVDFDVPSSLYLQ